MSDYAVLGDLLVIYAVSTAVVFVFHQFRLPSIAGFLVAGALIGPHGLHLIPDVSQVQVLAEIGIVLLLFTIGMEFSSAHFASARRILAVAAPVQTGGVLILALLGALAVGLSYQQGIFWGFLLSLSSTAIVLKALSEQGESDSFHGRATVAILIFQDLAVVPMMLITPILATPSGSAMGMVLLTLLKAGVVVVLIVAAAWYLVPRLLRHIVRSRSRELFLLSIIVLCLGIAWLTSLGGLSLALGAFIAGLVMSESEYSHQALAEVLPTIHSSCWGFSWPSLPGNCLPARERWWPRALRPGRRCSSGWHSRRSANSVLSSRSRGRMPACSREITISSFSRCRC